MNRRLRPSVLSLGHQTLVHRTVRDCQDSVGISWQKSLTWRPSLTPQLRAHPVVQRSSLSAKQFDGRQLVGGASCRYLMNIGPLAWECILDLTRVRLSRGSVRTILDDEQWRPGTGGIFHRVRLEILKRFSSVKGIHRLILFLIRRI